MKSIFMLIDLLLTRIFSFNKAWLAQSVEHLTLKQHKVNQKVAGSSPASGFLFILEVFLRRCLNFFSYHAIFSGKTSEAHRSMHRHFLHIVSECFKERVIDT